MIGHSLALIFLSWIIQHAGAAVTLESTSSLIDTKDLTCGENVVLKCRVSPFGGGSSMSWSSNTSLTTCLNTGTVIICTPNTKDHYAFTTSLTEEMFNLTYTPVKYSDSSLTFSCSSGSDSDSITVSVKVLPEESSTVISNSSETTIKVTTGCVYPPESVTFEWMYYKENEVEANAVLYTFGSETDETETSTSCTDQNCGGTDVKPRSSTLMFKEGTVAGNYYFKAVISHSAWSEQVTKTIGPFALEAPTPAPTPGSKLDCWVVVIIVVGVIIGLVLTGCCCGCLWGDQRKGCFNCEASDCGECCQCCDNNCVRCRCCGSFCNIKGLPFWYHILWWTVIGTPVSLGIFISVKCRKKGNGDVEPRVRTPRNETQSGNPQTDQKKSETKKNKSKDSVAHTANEQHNQGRKQPPPPSDAGAAAGTTLNGREDSDGAVSREHVDLQESGRTLKQRPMPDIPRKTERQGHDSKGRGLSANLNDDDHPLIGVNIPIQKAGALEALPEGTGGDGSVKKLKKKKKKSKDQEDEV